MLILLDANDPARQSLVAALRQSLRALGWDEATNIRIDERGTSDRSLARAFAAELAGLKPDVVLANGAREVTAALQVSRDIPIVFAAVSDPVGLGYVDSLARPGGNVTGFMLLEYSVVGKLLEALKEIAPGVKRAALLFGPDNPASQRHWRTFEIAARSLAVQPVAAPVRNRDEIERAIADIARESNGALLAPPDTVVTTHRLLWVASRRSDTSRT